MTPQEVVVLVGPPASGKTTLRRRLVAEGFPVAQVVSLDDLRREVAAHVAARGGPVRPPQAWTLVAVRLAAQRQEELLDRRLGYLADNTHLRRRERVAHVRAAAEAGLPARAVLLPEVALEVLCARNASRAPVEQVPDEVLVRHAHRRSLLPQDLLRNEGFDRVD